MRVPPAFGSYSWLLVAVALIASACQPGGGTTSTANASASTPDSDVGRFYVRPVSMRRGPPLLLRLDTATGETWKKGLMEQGAWERIEEKPGAGPEAGTEPDRYGVRPIAQQRGAPNLIRVDTVTGRTWRKGAASGGPWVPILMPGEEPTSITPLPSSPPEEAAAPEEAAEPSEGSADAP